MSSKMKLAVLLVLGLVCAAVAKPAFKTKTSPEDLVS